MKQLGQTLSSFERQGWQDRSPQVGHWRASKHVAEHAEHYQDGDLMTSEANRLWLSQILIGKHKCSGLF